MKREAIAIGLLWTAAALAWGPDGHFLSARAAARALPGEMPAFFRQSVEELAYLCSEPDRWRDKGRSPALTAHTSADHWMHMENIQPALPATRYEFLLANVGRKNAAGRPLTVEDLGTVAYAIAEYAERLTGEFRRWRAAPEETAEQRRVKRQIEQSIIYTGGVLGHWITDPANPLHATAHHNGWDPELPNPREFAGKGIHGRFEADYVRANIAEGDIAARIGPPRAAGGWLEEAERHLRASQALVEKVYELDQQVPFGSGQESAEAKALAAGRLAAGAALLRDVWHSAWVKSQ